MTAPTQAVAFIGAHTSGGAFAGRSRGIVCAAHDATDGSLGPVIGTARCPYDPTWLASSYRRPLLIAACHTSSHRGLPGGALVSFEIDAEAGRLAQIDEIRLPAPHVTQVSLDQTERFAMCTSSLGGALTMVEIESAGTFGAITQTICFDGEVILPPNRLPEPPFVPGTRIPIVRSGFHTQPHCAIFDARNEFVLACDLAQNSLHLLSFDIETGLLDLVETMQHPCEHAGPRQLALHPDGAHFYSIEENGLSVTAYKIDAASKTIHILDSGALVAFRNEASTWTGGGLVVHPTGKWLYASIRGYDHVARVALDGPGSMSVIETVPSGGSFARTLTLSPDGRFLYSPNTSSDSVTSFAVDAATGALALLPNELSVKSPTHVVFA